VLHGLLELGFAGPPSLREEVSGRLINIRQYPLHANAAVVGWILDDRLEASLLGRTFIE
jgi:hypothetical protein